MKAGLNFSVAILAAVIAVLGASIFTVDQRQFAIVFQLGEVREEISEPGLYFKWPLIQNVRYFEKRILLERLGEPVEVARAVRFLLSDEASYITAAQLVVDGGNISSQRG